MKIFILINQLVCIGLVAAGIIVEVHLHADLGFILITAGAFAFGVNEKLDKNRIKRELRGKSNSHKKRNYE